MPELQDTLSEALPELTTEAITGSVVVVCRSKEPAGYFFVAQTTDGSDPNLWKDGLFKSKVACYLSSTRDNSQSSDVLIDMRLIDLKDTLPKDIIPIKETVDTKEPALRKRRLCVKLGLNVATKTAVCDIQIQGMSELTPAHYTCSAYLDRPVEGRMNIIAKQFGELVPNEECPSIHPQKPLNQCPTQQAMDGVPFTISEKFANTPEEYEYDFSMEHSIRPYLPTRHTQSQY